MLWKLLLAAASIFSHHEHTDPDNHVEFVPTPHGPQSLREEAIARNALHGKHFGGDMIFPDDWNQTDAGVRDTRFRWPGYPGGGTVPFVIDRSLWQIRELIYQAMRYYAQHTCIQFVERTNEPDYVYLYYGDGCWSIIGRNGGPQRLSLGEGCHFFGLVVHELGHAIGLIHEHQRSDRDNYIYVYKQNVVQGQEHNFNRVEAQNELLYTEYDYDSIMHYGNYAFSRDPRRLLTMQAKNGHPLREPYDKDGFTRADVYSIKQLYQCRG